MKGYLVVEGFGEVDSAQNLITRLSQDLGYGVPWSRPLRMHNLSLWSNRKGSALVAAEFIRTKRDAGALLILLDSDEKCPKNIAPEFSLNLASLNLPFPTGYVMFKPEYEVIFLPCLHRMTDLGLSKHCTWDEEHWESRRDVKGWLSRHMSTNRRYKPTVDQLAMTQRINFDEIRSASIPCFQSLERAVIKLCENFGKSGVVYP